MKHKVVISTNSQVFEFIGEITEMTDNYIYLVASKGEIYIERKYLVFIQFLNDEPAVEETMAPLPTKPDSRAAVKLVKQQLKHDPLAERLAQKLIPPSQLPDDAFEDVQYDTGKYVDEDDNMEVQRKVNAAFGIAPPQPPPGPKYEKMREGYKVPSSSLKDAIKSTMNNSDDEDFTMPAETNYASPLKTILGMNNANNKKTRRD